MQQSIPEIYDYQVGYCLNIGRIADTGFVSSILKYRSDPQIIRLEKRISEKFSSLKNHEQAIGDGLKHLKYHLFYRT